MAYYPSGPPLLPVMGIDNAYAGIKLPRINGRVLGNAIKEALEKGLRSAISEGGVADALGATAKILRSVEAKTMRKFVTDPKFLIATIKTKVKHGKQNLLKFISGGSDARIDPLLFVGVIAYLEYQMLTPAEVGESDPGYQKLTDDKLKDQINKQIGKALANIATDGAKGSEEEPDNELLRIAGTMHGAIFHISQIAWYQFKHQFINGEPIKGVDMGKRIFLYKSQKDFEDPKRPFIRAYTRYVDIVLGKKDEGPQPSSEEWIELKSLKRKEIGGQVSLRDFQQWGLPSVKANNKGKTYHKQFYLDRVARTREGMARTPIAYFISNEPINVTRSSWWFQNFEVKIKDAHNNYTGEIINSYSPQDVGIIKTELKKLPLASNKPTDKDTQARNYSIGIDPESSQSVAEAENDTMPLNVNVESLTLKNVLEDFALHDLLPAIVEQIEEQM